MLTLIQELTNMGYRPSTTDQTFWFKPVGYSLYSFDLSTKTWGQRFLSHVHRDVRIWDTAIYDDFEDLGEFLAHCETYHTHHFKGSGHFMNWSYPEFYFVDPLNPVPVKQVWGQYCRLIGDKQGTCEEALKLRKELEDTLADASLLISADLEMLRQKILK